MDNASNNKTFLEFLQAKLNGCDIDFDAEDRGVMCFGHTVELASGRVVNAASGGAEEDRGDSSADGNDSPSDGGHAAPSNPVVHAHTVVRTI